MAPRKREDLKLPTHRNQESVLPRPILHLYNRASLFLDKQSAVHDHYWAVGIHKAVHASFPECGETQAAKTKPPGRLSSGQVSPQTPQTQRSRWRSTSNASRKQGKTSAEIREGQLAFKFTNETGSRVSPKPRNSVVLHRFQRTVSMKVGQRAVLICTIWSTRNRMQIQSGTWGEISDVGSTIKVEWELPSYLEPLWDCFPPDEYLDYFEEG